MGIPSIATLWGPGTLLAPSFTQTDDKDHLPPIYWKLIFSSQLELFKCRSSLSPNRCQTLAEWARLNYVPSAGSAHTVTLHGFLLFICVTSPLW